jgi:thiol-disulfide isomerase/thioredoxin
LKDAAWVSALSAAADVLLAKLVRRSGSEFSRGYHQRFCRGGILMRASRKSILLAGLFSIVAVLMPALSSAFDLKDTDGTAQRLKDLKGTWVVVNFWATWCAPCVKEIPEIADFAKEQGKKTRVIGVALDWDESGKKDVDEAKLKRAATKIGHTYPLVLGDDKTEKVFGKIKGMPTTIVYGPDGKVVYNKTGVVTKELLTRVVNGEKVK